eukprot:m.56769 g.56769  ORF g.56769 m.56769 type:complete len:1124 (+) comp11061_c0_seq3:334-3705(+)
MSNLVVPKEVLVALDSKSSPDMLKDNNDEKMSVDEDDEELLDVTNGVQGTTRTNKVRYPTEVKLECPPNDELKAKGEFEFKIPKVAQYPGRQDTRSDVHIIGGLPWRLMAYPAGNGQESVGVFLELEYPHEAYDQMEQCGDLYVICKLECISQTDPKWSMGKVFNHRYFDPLRKQASQNWGYKSLLPVADLHNPQKGYVVNGAAVFKASLMITDGGDPEKWQDLSTYNSFVKTGMVGLRNQGMTCYMNSVLQTLYHTTALRRGVYIMETADETAATSVALGIQRVFYRLQTHQEAVGTQELTRSFGWNVVDSFMQHDVQEFLRVLIDKMEEKMKGSEQEKLLETLYGGKMKSYIKCTNVDYESARTESFLDIQLTVKGIPNLIKSFEDYIEVEMLDGDNKYQAEGHGLQDAKKGVIFQSFPPVLNLQLRRFEYNMLKDESYKVNDRFEFQEHINLDQFLEKPEDTPADYTLHSVLVQGGDLTGGHYVAFIRPDPKGDWFKFDDEHCVRTTPEAAIEGNFGLAEGENHRAGMSNAYMLVYIRDSVLNDIVRPIKVEEIPEQLRQRFSEEEEAARRKEQEELDAYNRMTIVAVELDQIQYPNKLDFPDPLDAVRQIQDAQATILKVPKQSTIPQLYDQLAEKLGRDVNHLKIFPMEKRENKTTRPGEPLTPRAIISDQRPLDAPHGPLSMNFQMIGSHQYCPLYISFDEKTHNDKDHALIFCKFYDPKIPSIRIVHAIYPKKNQKLKDFNKIVLEKAGMPTDLNVEIAEELHDGNYPVRNQHTTFADAQLQHGDILLWSVAGSEGSKFLEKLFYELRVEFRELEHPYEPGFTLALDGRLSYQGFAGEVAKKLGCQPNHLQFTVFEMDRVGGTAVNGPSEYKILSNTRYTLNNLLHRGRSRWPLLYYKNIEIPIHELEKLAEATVFYLDTSNGLRLLKNSIFYTPNSPANTIINQVKEKMRVPKDVPHRLILVSRHRITKVIDPNEILDNRLDGILRLDPIEQNSLVGTQASRRIVEVIHIFKSYNRHHGIPFHFSLIDGESIKALRQRLQTFLKVPPAEFAKWKLGVLYEGTPSAPNEYPSYEVDYISDDDILEFRSLPQSFLALCLDHVDKSQQYNSGAIKIHN